MRTNVPLTATEAAFCAALAAGEPPTTAIRTAGMSIGMAAVLMHRRNVAAVVRDLHARLGKVVQRIDAGLKPRRSRSVV